MKVIDKEYLETQFKNYNTVIDGAYLKKNQGATNNGKILQIDSSGLIVPVSLINDTTASTSSVYSSNKVNSLLSSKATINDTTVSTSSVFSSDKISNTYLAKNQGTSNVTKGLFINTLGQIITAPVYYEAYYRTDKEGYSNSSKRGKKAYFHPNGGDSSGCIKNPFDIWPGNEVFAIFMKIYIQGALYSYIIHTGWSGGCTVTELKANTSMSESASLYVGTGQWSGEIQCTSTSDVPFKVMYTPIGYTPGAKYRTYDN